VRNSLNPSWGEDLELALVAGPSATAQQRLRCEVWDQDSTTLTRFDDTLGYIEIPLGGNGGK